MLPRKHGDFGVQFTRQPDGSDGIATKGEGLTIDPQLRIWSGCYPKASLDWAWGELLAGRAAPDPFFTCVRRCCFLYGEGRRIGPRALSLGRR